jgi:wyosine [tRNA(Phe)-imidazoG37] synthetase (radical SAM superfamily)
MSFWTVKLLEIKIALFYLIHIMLKRCLKCLSTFNSPMSHRMIQKIHLVKNYDDGVLQEKYAQIIGSFMF